MGNIFDRSRSTTIDLPESTRPDIAVPDHSWRKKVPPELATEMVALRREHDDAIRDALKAPETSQRFLTDPAGVLDDLGIPISNALRQALKGPNGMEKLSVARRLRLPVNQIVEPLLNLQIGEQPDGTPLLHPLGVSPLAFWSPPANFFKPTGQLNHGFPVVYEVTKTCIHDLIAQWFDRGPLHDLISNLMKELPASFLNGLKQLAEEFDLELNLGMPPGKSSAYPDIFTVTLAVPGKHQETTSSDDGVRLSICLSISASVIVDHSSPDKEQFYMDLVNYLVDCEAKITFENLPLIGGKELDLSSAFRLLLQKMAWGERPGTIPVFFDVPIDRSGAQALLPTQLDLRIIDDTSSKDCDAIALLMSFKDMGPGALDQFTQSFISTGSGLVVDFNWLRAKILPKLQAALGLPTPIDPGTGFWFGAVPIKNGDGALLTALALGVTPGTNKITVFAAVRKAGDCYTATGSLSATMSIRVENGVLHFDPPQFGQPSVNIDIPWYCYLLSAVLGGILGGILFDVVGTLVGATLAPILLHSIQGIAESILIGVVNTINKTVQSETAGIQQIDLGNMKSLLQYASIDDLATFYNVATVDSIPALQEKNDFIPNGGYLDPVTGQIGQVGGIHGDLAVVGTGPSRVLLSVGNTALALVGNFDPETVTRYRLYHCSFNTTQRLALTQLATWDGKRYQPNGLVYAVRTEDGHYARFTVTSVVDDGLWIHYKTYPIELGEKVPVLELRGKFTANLIHDTPSAESQPRFKSLAGTAAVKWGDWFDPNSHWYNQGTFYVNWVGFKEPLRLEWKVQSQALTGKTGRFTLNGAQVQYEIYGSQLDLMVDPDVVMDIEIEAVVTDARGRKGTASLIARTMAGDLRISSQPTVPLDIYIATYKKHVGPWIDIDPEQFADQGYRVDTSQVTLSPPEIIG